jgi:hypothetical protein
LQRLRQYSKFILAFFIAAALGVLYKLFFTDAPLLGGGSFGLLFLVVGIALGAAVVYGIMRMLGGTPQQGVARQDASVIINKIERVFKVVCAEGHFSEVFDYSHTTKIAMVIPSTKKALLIVHGKVLMGYDFKKAELSVDPETNAVRFTKMPPPEVLSIEQDLKYYNLDNGLFNKFDNEDLSALQAEAKQKVLQRVAQSNLGSIANAQLQHLLSELKEVHQWKLDVPQ